MNFISRDTDYALRAILFMAAAGGGRISAARIEEATGMPKPFLRKILQILQKHSILDSVKGHEGGFKLLKKLEDINLLEIMSIFQKDMNLSKCLFKKQICPNTKTCLIRKKINTIEEMVINELKSIQLSSLFNQKKGE